MKASTFRDILLILLFCPLNQVSAQQDSTDVKGKEPDFVNYRFRERTSMFYIAGKTGLENIQGNFSSAWGIYTCL
jgi:hypothetical protein